MVKVKFVNGKPMGLPAYSREGDLYAFKLLKVLNDLKKRLKKDFMNQIFIFGGVGTGKTTLAFLIVNYLSNGRFNLNDLGVGERRCLKLLVECKPNSTILLDDASSLFMSTEFNKKSQKKAVKVMQLIRDKNINVIITLPDLSKTNSYIATSSNCIIKTYLDETLSRGQYAFYGTRKVNSLYTNIKKNNGNTPIYPAPDFTATFSDFRPKFYNEYKELKEKARRDVLYDKPEVQNLKEMKPLVKQLLEQIPNMKKPITYRQFCDLTSLSKSTISNYKAEIDRKTRENG